MQLTKREFILTYNTSCNIISYMKRDSKLFRIIHILLYMAEHQEPSTSASLAKMLFTNPVVVRQIMSGLRKRGYVQSEKGHGGGWKLSCDLSKVTLLDIYTALGSPSLLAIGKKTETHGCLVEQTVNCVLGQILHDTEGFLMSRLGGVTLADLNADLCNRFVARGNRNKQKGKHHAL